MIDTMKKLARTLITFFPGIKNQVYLLKRFLQSAFDVSIDEDFKAIKLFPDKPNALYLDVGGNQGAVIDTLLLKNKNCRVYSFEPNPEVYRLTSSRFKNNPRVDVFNFGLGKEEGEFKLYVPVYRGYEFDGLGSLDSNFDDVWLAESIFFFNQKFLSVHEVNCNIKRLDDLDLDPFFIKIDVEGFELEVLLGGEKTIEKSRPIMLVESVEKDGKIMAFVEKFGYKIYRYWKGNFIPGEQGSPNSFLMTDDKFDLLKK
jgi:FkbM family methyltransferase